MKKILYIAALLIAGVASAFAVEYTAKVKITLNESALTLREASQFSDAYDNGYDIAQFNKAGIAVEAVVAGQEATEWVQWGTNELEETKVAFKVAAAGEQTITFSSVEGTPLYLVDAVANKIILIENSGSYTFTAEAADAADWNTTRFSITKVAPKAFAVCFRNQVLSVEGYEGTTTVTGIDNNYSKIFTNDFEQTFTTGKYQVTYTDPADSQEKTVIFNANPDVKPAN